MFIPTASMVMSFRRAALALSYVRSRSLDSPSVTVIPTLRTPGRLPLELVNITFVMSAKAAAVLVVPPAKL